MILAALKASTADLHDRVEAVVDIPSRVQNLASYRRLIARFHGFYAPFEPALAAVPGLEVTGLDLAARRKVPNLRRDLAALGLSPEEIAALPTCDKQPTPRTVAETLGSLYVLEGATLGGRFIRREVEATLGLSADSGCAFFHGYGEATGPMWKEFGRIAEANVVGPDAQAEAIAAAIATFEAFERWFAPQTIVPGEVAWNDGDI